MKPTLVLPSSIFSAKGPLPEHSAMVHCHLHFLLSVQISWRMHVGPISIFSKPPYISKYIYAYVANTK